MDSSSLHQPTRSRNNTLKSHSHAHGRFKDCKVKTEISGFFFTVKFLSISDHLKKKTDFSCKESQKKNGLKCVETIKGRLPHVDQILGERHSIGSTRNCDGSVRRAALPVVAI